MFGNKICVAIIGTGLIAIGCRSAGHPPRIDMATARATALKEVPGTVRAEKLESEDGQTIYSFEIKPADEKGKFIKEVNVSAETGKVVGVETEAD